MKFILVIGFALMLVGCQTATDVATSITTVNQSVRDKVSSVQSYATQLCRFVPTAATVISIFSGPTGQNVATVANAICDAVTTRPLADGPGSRVPRVAGVRIQGRFVN